MVRSVRKPKLRVRRQRLNKEPHTGREEAKRRDGKAMAMAMARQSHELKQQQQKYSLEGEGYQVPHYLEV